MTDSDLEVSQGDLVHDLSPEIVIEAFRLTKYGRQQLHTILEPGKTFFKFTVSFEGHTVQTSILISTVVCQESGHSSSHVAGRYWPCCHQVLDEKIRLGIESVYNAYIRANRQTFNDNWCGTHHRYFHFEGANRVSLTRFPSRANPVSCTRQQIPNAQLNLRPQNESYQSTDGGESLLPAQRAIRSPRTGVIDHGDDNVSEYTSEENSHVDDLPPEKKRRESLPNSKIAERLTQNINWGLKKVKNRKTAYDPFAVDKSYFLEQSQDMEAMRADIVAKIKKIQVQNLQRERVAVEDLEKLDKLFEQGEVKSKKHQNAAKMTQWWFWYFSSCLRIVLYWLRGEKRDRKANGAYVIHMIVNELLTTVGIKALVVIAALAGKREHLSPAVDADKGTEQGYYMTNMRDLPEASLVEIGKLVATSLKNELHPPSKDYLLPMAVDWVSMVTKLRYIQCHVSQRSESCLLIRNIAIERRVGSSVGPNLPCCSSRSLGQAKIV
jgi:hypothetical protein